MSDIPNGPDKGPITDNANSPWGSGGSNGNGNKPGGGKNPWGQGRPPNKPSRPQGGQQNPDIDNVIRGLKDKFGGPKGGGGNGKGGRPQGAPNLPLPWIILGAGFLYLLASSIYTVDQQEEGVVLRFGEYRRTVGPGLNLKLPTPIEQVIKAKTREVQKIDIGGNTRKSLMLTGDENIVDIDFTVLWRISSLENFLFEVDEVENAVQAVAQSAMREVVGKSELERIITTDRFAITTATRDLMQSTLNEYGAGVEIVEVQLQKADPPTEGGVIDASREVENAAQEAETMINQATAVQNSIVPNARGQAAEIIQDAEGYAGRVTAEAKGEAERFSLVLKEYKAAPRVTRQRLYLETMEDVFEKGNVVIMDSSGSGAVPYLSLNELAKPKGGN